MGKPKIEAQLWRDKDKSTGVVLQANLGSRALFIFLIFNGIFV